MMMSVTLPEASSANGDETLWTSADPQPGPTSELPTLPSQLLAYRGQDQPQGYLHQEALLDWLPCHWVFPFPFRSPPSEPPEAYSGSAGKCFINCKARHNREFLKTTFKDAVIQVRREAPASWPEPPHQAHTPMELWNRRRRCWMKLEMERAGLQRPFPAVTQPPQSRLGRERRVSRQGWETPSSGSGTTVLARFKAGPM